MASCWTWCFASDINSDLIIFDLEDTGRKVITCMGKPCDGAWEDEYKTRYLVLKKICVENPDFVSPDFKVGGTTNYYYMAVFETTQRQWELVMGDRPSYFLNDKYYAQRPVENVSYDRVLEDSDSFVKRLRERFQMPGFDLPTECQWVYACMAGGHSFWGTNTTFELLLKNVGAFARVAESTPNSDMYFGDWNPKMDWHRLTGCRAIRRFAPSKGGTTSVGSYPPNAYGLYDMFGNVAELCKGWYGDSSQGKRPVLGGGWKSPLHSSPPAMKSSVFSDGNYCEISDKGFRIVFNLMENGSASEFVGIREPILHYTPSIEKDEPYDIDVESDGQRTKSAILTNCTAKTVTIVGLETGKLHVAVNISTNFIAPFAGAKLEVTLDKGFEKSVNREGILFDDTFFINTVDGGRIPIRLSGWFFHVQKNDSTIRGRQ